MTVRPEPLDTPATPMTTVEPNGAIPVLDNRANLR